MNNNLTHYGLNEPHQGLNGWGKWFRRALTIIGSFAGGPVAIAAAVISVVKEISDENNLQRVDFGVSVTNDYEPTAQEEPYLDDFLNNKILPFVEYVNLIVNTINQKTNFGEQLQEYNNLLNSYSLFKNYYKNHRIKEVSKEANKLLIDVIEVYFNEAVKLLDARFDVDNNTTIQNQTNSFVSGDVIEIDTITLNVIIPFTHTYKFYSEKITETVKETVKIPTTDTGTETGTGTGTDKLPYWKKHPVSSILLGISGLLVVRKLLK